MIKKRSILGLFIIGFILGFSLAPNITGNSISNLNQTSFSWVAGIFIIMSVIFFLITSLEERATSRTLFHGSKKKLNSLKRQKASAPRFRPRSEDLNAIYLTPDLGFALACAIRPKGRTEINHDKKVIRFENPEAYDPNQTVYVYSVDSSKIPKGKGKYVDKLQVAADVDELSPDSVKAYRAGDIEQFYSVETGEKIKGRTGWLRDLFSWRS